MNAIIPLNVAAVRVNNTDQSNVVNNFKGSTAVFDQMPYRPHNQHGTSTGDQIYRPLQGAGTAYSRLGQGIHIHWELPDYFRRGVQPSNGSDPVFPHAPNRWLVIRYFSQLISGAYETPKVKTWMVESDYLSNQLPAPIVGSESRPTISVPLPAGNQPFMYMGQVLDYSTWNPASEQAANYLPSKTGADGKNLFLTAMGFVGPAFSSYYPECCSVFGFWDAFDDMPNILTAINCNDQTVQFKVSYQVVGWIDDASQDPLVSLNSEVTKQYNDMLAQYNSQSVKPDQTPADILDAYTRRHFGWTVNKCDIPFTLDDHHNITSLTVPGRTLCSGVLQEIVWSLDQNAVTQGYLANTDQNAPAKYLWTDKVELAVGNTNVEALSALLKKDLSNTDNDPDLLKNYEYLLDAFQLGLLKDLESNDHPIFNLDEQLHARAFARVAGGQLWTIQPLQAPDSGKAPDPDREITLPLELAEQLHLLNAAQKKYDQARALLQQRREQLFMDWFTYLKLKVGDTPPPNVTSDAVGNFIYMPDSAQCELATVIQAGTDAGILLYTLDPDSGQITGLQQPAGTTSDAYAVWQNYQALSQALSKYPQWMIQAAPAPPFWSPTDPVLLMKGDRIEPVLRNGNSNVIAARLSTELLNEIKLNYSGTDWTIDATKLSCLPALNPQQPMSDDVGAVIVENAMLMPMMSGLVASVLQSQQGNNNPAGGSNLSNFIATLQSAQGNPNGGLYFTIRQDGYVPVENPVQKVTAPMAIDFTFTNAAATGWAPDPVAWNAQQLYPEFNTSRLDPFLPTFLIWNAQLNSLVFNNTQNQASNYDANNLTDYFQLDGNDIDYLYKMNNGTAVPFTKTQPASMKNSIVLSKKPTYSLTKQIANYLKNYPDDPAKQALNAICTAYNNMRIMSQGLDGFNIGQMTRNYIPQVTVNNLVSRPGMDPITPKVHDAAQANPQDNWYDFSFNNVQPLATGFEGMFNFGSLRSGFMDVTYLEIVDVFGQRMQLLTPPAVNNAPLETTVALPLQPEQGDTAHATNIYLPPRLLAPTRLWFRWLSAAFNKDIDGVDSDFVEMNTHPATSPVCGWIVPNHLDYSLMFYDADGTPIGSFGLEHNDQVYRTNPANIPNNESDSLSADIGPQGSPTVNPNLANFMWYFNGQGSSKGNFLIDLMNTFESAGQYINPANHPQDAGLSVFIGRPLAITRTVLGLETAGNALPISQANTSATDAFPSDINAPVSQGRYDYLKRQKYSASSLDAVQFPLRLGDLTQMDDGLVGFLIETKDGYAESTIYSAAAPPAGANHVTQPAYNTISLALNTDPMVLTLLVDPRAAVHATTGILPVSALQIPPDQYARTMQNLEVTFFTHPMIAKRQGLVTPLPQEAGYGWNWLQPVGTTVQSIPQKSNAVDDTAMYDYTPQTLMEGWLQLKEVPDNQ